MADKKGFYKEAGLDVQIKHTAVSESSFSILRKGEAQAAVMNLSFALTTPEADLQIVNIMQTSQENSLMLVSRHPIKDIESLRHEEIAVWNHLSEELLERIASYYKLDGKWVRFNGGVNLFLSGAVDICLVVSYNEYLQLAECGLKSDSYYTCHFSDYGYDLPEDGLYVTRNFYNEHPDAVRELVQASIRGWKWANEHPKETLDIVMELVRENNIGTNRYHQDKMLREILRLQVDKSCNQRTYRLSREAFEYASGILLNDREKRTLSYTDFVK
ncbi:MAG: ABC transporter substrate-binding protein [Parabacteroides sp.]|nr:ABC transporter substrate-binding protein [Parabacteroides sp.]